MHRIITYSIFCLLSLALALPAFAQLNNNIFNGGNADGHEVACFLQVSNNSIFAGGSNDGHEVACFIQISNNNIFAGGNADGHEVACFVQTSNNSIFAGGMADGHEIACFVQTSNNSIFAGGMADGFEVACFTQISNNSIFAGGDADGFNVFCFTQTSNNAIFGGGVADGHVVNCFVQASNNSIFAGGLGDGFDLMCVTENPALLPIELLTFQGVLDGETALLKWVTVVEINNDYFILERSLNAVDFEEVAEVDAAGNTTVQQNYFYEDPVSHLIGNPVVYYRLKQVDFDGSFAYTNVIALPLPLPENGRYFVVFPNPAVDAFYLRYQGPDEEQDITIQLFDNLGRLLIDETIDRFSAYSGYPVDISGLLSGAYQLLIIDGQHTATSTVIKIGP